MRRRPLAGVVLLTGLVFAAGLACRSRSAVMLTSPVPTVEAPSSTRPAPSPVASVVPSPLPAPPAPGAPPPLPAPPQPSPVAASAPPETTPPAPAPSGPPEPPRPDVRAVDPTDLAAAVLREALPEGGIGRSDLPPLMWRGKTETFRAWIGSDVSDTVRRDVEPQRPPAGPLEPIKVVKHLRLALVGNDADFRIDLEGRTEHKVLDARESASWVWHITPLRAGERKTLALKAYLLVPQPGSAEGTWREKTVYEQSVSVGVTRIDRARQLWDDYKGFIVMLLIAGAGLLAAQGWRRRRSGSP